MSDAILIFTFTPIQSFIVEARRAQDLFMGSRILSDLAKAAGKEIGYRNLVYPANVDKDAPNILVAQVPLDQAETLATNAADAIQTRWNDFQRVARQEISRLELKTDPTWEAIWQRQVKSWWQIYWSAAPIINGDYRSAYETARDHLDAVKRSRLFSASEPEEGRKDSLSGKRAALHTEAYPDARAYWAEATNPTSTKILPSKVRPGGREMLDAIGAVKRFASKEAFLSTSTVAAFDYLIRASQAAPTELNDYRIEVKKLIGDRLVEITSITAWPYDGDLLYKEILTKKRLCDDYGLAAIDEPQLEVCKSKLELVYKKQGPPPLYYALLAIDGDSMGARLDQLLSEPDPVGAHHRFSQSIADFAAQVPGKVSKEFLIYNGGDDILCMLPPERAIRIAQVLSNLFQQMTGNSASAGLAILHHQAPLDAGLEAARRAERAAKQIPGKATICVHAWKRSGALLEARSPWSAFPILVQDSDGTTRQVSIFSELVQMFQSGALSARFAYDSDQSTRTLTSSGEIWQSELKRLIGRHRDQKTGPDPQAWSERLNTWSSAMPEPSSRELAHWLILARFLAQGGSE